MSIPVSTARAFGLRQMAIDAMERADALTRAQEADLLRSRRANLSATFRTRLLRLLNFDGVPLTATEEAMLDQHWFAVEALDPDVVADRRISAVNGTAPVIIIDGVMLAPTANGLLVATWRDGEPPADHEEITSLSQLGRWCAARQQHDEEQAVNV